MIELLHIQDSLDNALWFNGSKSWFEIHPEYFENKNAQYFNISEGFFHHSGHRYWFDDSLRQSPLSGFGTTERFRVSLWSDLKKYLPRYKKNRVCPDNTYFLWALLRILEAEKSGPVYLVYTNDLERAELIIRCLNWLKTEIEI